MNKRFNFQDLIKCGNVGAAGSGLEKLQMWVWLPALEEIATRSFTGHVTMAHWRCKMMTT